MRRKGRPPEKTKSKIGVLYQGLFFAFIIMGMVGVSYLFGQYHPNKKTVQQLEEAFHEDELDEVTSLGLVQPEFMYNDPNGFVVATSRCVDYLNFTTNRHSRVPTSIIIAMAGIETGWGTSRFAIEGNNLFGIRTWDLTEPHIKPKDVPDANFGLKKYATKCDSVKDMIRILNTHPAYTEFRIKRTEQIKNGRWDYASLLLHLDAWSSNPNYSTLILRTINERELP